MTDAELDQCRHDGALLFAVVSRKVKLKREGREWKGCCPFHAEKTPSFTVYTDGRYHCFGCAVDGTVFDFVMANERVNFPAAVNRVAAEKTLKRKKVDGNGTHRGEMWQPIMPPPADALKPTEAQLRCDMLHEYPGTDDRMLCFVRRVEAKGDKRKQFYPLTFGVLNGKRGWHNKAPDAPRPLYGLNRLSHADPAATVILVEGEKKADAAQRLFPHYVAMSWMGGARADGDADLSPLAGRDMILWPDADQPGLDVMARIARRLPLARRIVDTDGLPAGFDAADLEHSGIDDPETWLEARLRKLEPLPAEPAFNVEPWNPWDDPPLPDWPGGVLPHAFEDTLAGICLRDGLDFPALAMSYITAASGAAPKDARFCPYQGDAWRVPPIMWLMLVAESGQRKTQTINHALSIIKQRHSERWREYRVAMKVWKETEGHDKSDKPDEPAPYYTNDITVERLQQLLAENDRGLLYCRDELASFLDFGRYSQSKGDGPRAFFLETYEAGPHTLHRVGRETVFIQNAALTLMGGIQPSRLSAFKGLEDDGLLQRFAVVRAGPVGREKPAHVVRGKELIDQGLDRLLAMPFAQHRYRTDAEGSALIASTRAEGEAYAALPDFGLGFQGFANKLHGTHARLALILHMLELPERNEIPTDTVERAGQLTGFLLRHAAGFYSSIPGSAIEITRAVASLLLRLGKPRVLASDLTTNVRLCRAMTLKDIAPVLAPLVAGGWITPEEPFADNRAWLVTPGLAELFAARTKAEVERAATARRRIRSLFPGEAS